jgi:hypothetical protein
MTYKLNGRPVELEIDNDDGMYFVISGNYTDCEMEDLTEDECEEAGAVNNGAIDEDMMGSAIDRAHDSMDMER